MEPPVSLHDTPVQYSGFHGLTGIGKSGWYPAIAPSVKFSLPSRTEPAAASLEITVASKSGT